MRVRLGVLTAVALLGVTGSAAAPAAPDRDMVIRMGKGIGKVERGMTLQQVRHALGGPHVSVYRRANFGALGRYLELGWELPGRTSWEPVVWTVGFRSVSASGRLRVVRIATTARSERTPQGLGIGSRPRQIVRAHPRATCVSRTRDMPYPFNWVVVGDARAGMTLFQIESTGGAGFDPDAPRKVVQVMVQRDWFSKGRGHGECGRGWERW